MNGTFETWERWMLEVQMESGRSSYDDTGRMTTTITLRYLDDPETVLGFLGEQVRSCVYRPAAVFVDNFLEGFHDELEEIDPETIEIYNVVENRDGIGNFQDIRTGYQFRMSYHNRSRLGCYC